MDFDWIISDTHFGHRNINKYCNRLTPAFPTPEAVDNLMRSNWHALVKPDDRILHLGDLCYWGDGKEMPELAALPGKKSLLKGNHDLYPDRWYEDHGFTIVDEGEVDFLFVHELGEALVKFRHLPIIGLSPGEVNVYGHVHNNPHYSTPSHLNVCVELTHFAPLPMKAALGNLMWHHTKFGGGRR